MRIRYRAAHARRTGSAWIPLLVLSGLAWGLGLGPGLLPSPSTPRPVAAQPGATASATPFRPAPTATATVSPGEGLCTVQGRQTAGATRVERWLPLELEVSLSAECPEEAQARADILLLLDRSSSMGEGGKHEAAIAAVEQFVAAIDFGRHRVGLVSFNDSPWVAQPLTDRPDRVIASLGTAGRPSGGTNIGAAIRMAEREWAQTGRGSAVGVAVLLTDGQQASERAMLEAAQEAREAGIVLFAIGLGEDAAHAALRRVADDPERYYDAPDKEDLEAIYEQIAALIRAFRVTDIQLVERVAPGVEHEAGSGSPEEPSARNDVLLWRRSFLTGDPVTWTHRVRIARLGRVRPAADLWVEYSDGDGARRLRRLERAEVEVHPPVYRFIHLPFLAQRWCFPAKRHADVALVLDASSSMAGDKLSQAVAGAEGFVELLELAPGGDRAAVVRYDAQAAVVEPLGRDEGALRAALRGIRTGSGTRIDAGLRGGLSALAGDRGDDNRRVIVLLTDGRQSEGRAELVGAVALARAQGVEIHAVALGDNADLDLLRMVAGDPGRTWVARDAAALVDTYRAVAGAVGCR